MAVRTFLVVLLLGIVQKCLSQDACTTPNNAPGQCLTISSCPSILALVRRRPISNQDSAFIRLSQCGFSSNLPKVCCPDFVNSGSETGTVPESESPMRPVEPANNNLIPGLDVCGPDTQDRIVGGTETELGEFPWMALLEYKTANGGGFHCGGVLISSRYVLTAAHCIDVPKIYKLVSVRLGEHNTATDIDCSNTGECAPAPEDVPVEKVTVHENYQPKNKSRPNDIALIRLSRPVSFDNDFIQPICLPFKNPQVLKRNFAKDQPSVAGWGRTEKTKTSDVKLKVRVTVVENSACSNSYKNLGAQIFPSHICAGGKAGEDSCKGDSGGPLMALEYSDPGANWYAIGIVSYGPKNCGTQNIPGVYTRVSEYSDWISRNVVP